MSKSTLLPFVILFLFFALFCIFSFSRISFVDEKEIKVEKSSSLPSETVTPSVSSVPPLDSASLPSSLSPSSTEASSVEGKSSPSRKTVYKIEIDTTPEAGDSPEILRIKQLLAHEKIDISMKDTPFNEAFLLFGNALKIKIFFHTDTAFHTLSSQVLSVEFKQASVQKIFQTLLNITGLVYFYEDDGIYISTIPPEAVEFLDHYQSKAEVMNTLFSSLKSEKDALSSIFFIKKLNSLTDQQKITYQFLVNQKNLEQSLIGGEIDEETRREFEQEIHDKFFPQFINILDKTQQEEFARLVSEKERKRSAEQGEKR
jgi:hypothetical protein